MKTKRILMLCLMTVCLCFFSTLAETELQNGDMSGTMTVSLCIQKQHRVSVRCGLHGSMLIDGEAFDGNQTLTLSKQGSFTVTAVPDEGYELSNVTVSIEEGITLEGNTLYVTGLDQDITVKLTFAKKSAHIHSIVTDEAVPATCTEPGLTEGSHCATCGAVIVPQEIIESLGHKPAVIEGVEADCTTPGMTEGAYCSVCGATLVEQTEIPAKGHDITHHEAKAATLTAAGWEAYDTCSRCDYTTYVEIPKLSEADPDNWENAFALPAGLILIEDEACDGTAVEYVIVSDGCEKIGRHAFANCTSLRMIFIPESVRQIAEDAFEDSAKVAIVSTSGSFAEQFAEMHNMPFCLAE